MDDEQPVFPRESSGVLEKVTRLLRNFNPRMDMIFFDWDQTIVGEDPVAGTDVREVRSPATLNLFKRLRAAYPGQFFIYSNGNRFIFDKIDGHPTLEQAAPYVPTYLADRNPQRAGDLLYYTDDGSNIDVMNRRTLSYIYLPTYPAFLRPIR